MSVAVGGVNGREKNFWRRESGRKILYNSALYCVKSLESFFGWMDYVQGKDFLYVWWRKSEGERREGGRKKLRKTIKE